ncbi:autophagy protein 5 [Trichonephila clavipes]|nr:autophagy protein 5 [Trichonephila clavipes]
MELNALWRVPLAHPWYFGKKPRWCHQLNSPTDRHTALSRLFSTFEQGQKVFPEYHRCEADQSSPSHIHNCLSFTFEGFNKSYFISGFLGDFWFYGDGVAELHHLG